MPRLLSFAVLLATWWIGSLLAGDAKLPPPPTVLTAMIAEARSGDLFFHLGVTLARVALAFTLAMSLGAAIGYLMGRVRLADRLGDPWLILLLNLPALVVIVLAYIWAGLTEVAAIAAIAINKLPTAVVTLREGARALDAALDEMATRVCAAALEEVPARHFAATVALYRSRRAIRAFPGLEDRPCCGITRTSERGWFRDRRGVPAVRHSAIACLFTEFRGGRARSLKPCWCSHLRPGYPGGVPVRLEVDIASKTFRNAAGEQHDVIAGVSFALDAGEVGVLVGPSGCGKSTMLRILAGLDPDFQGRISRPAGARIGFVFQEPRLLPWRSVEENVRLVAPQADEAKLSALFEILELNAHRNHFPGELSLGLARRVALARAFAVEPAFLILDEPLASLDAALAARMRDQIAMLMDNRSMITLLVTHDVDDAVRLGDRLFLLSPRPARILAELPIRTPRGARGEAEIAAIKLDVMRRINGDPSARESA